MAFDQNQYVNEYKRNNYDRLNILVPKGRAADIKEEAKSRGLSLSQLVMEALEVYCGINLSKIGDA